MYALGWFHVVVAFGVGFIASPVLIVAVLALACHGMRKAEAEAARWRLQ